MLFPFKYFTESLLKRSNIFSYSSVKKSHEDSYMKFYKKIDKIVKVKLWSLEDLISRCIYKKTTTSSTGQNKQKNLRVDQQIQTIEGFYHEDLQQQNQNQINIVLNRYFSTIQYLPSELNKKQELNSLDSQTLRLKKLYKNLIDTLNKSKTWKFVPHYYNIVHRHKTQHKNGLKLLIGDYNDALTKNLPQDSYITLQQFAAMFPQKIPLSYRSRQVTAQIRQKVENRINKQNKQRISMKDEPKFAEIIIINDKIKIWDQAYQIMLDQLPVKITVPFHLHQPSSEFYRLNLNDFMHGFKTSHKIIHPNIKLNIQQQNLQQFLSEFILNLQNDKTLQGKSQNKVQGELQNKAGNHMEIEIMDGQFLAHLKSQKLMITS